VLGERDAGADLGVLAAVAAADAGEDQAVGADVDDELGRAVLAETTSVVGGAPIRVLVAMGHLAFARVCAK
jgi:hypothetical protein